MSDCNQLSLDIRALMRVPVIGEIVKLGSTMRLTRSVKRLTFASSLYGIFNGIGYHCDFNLLFYNNYFFLFMTEWE